MEERNYNVVAKGTLTLTITLEEYRHLLRRDLGYGRLREDCAEAQREIQRYKLRCMELNGELKQAKRSAEGVNRNALL